MRRTLKVILALGAMAGSGCSTDIAAPTTEFNGIRYTAEIADIVTGTPPKHQFSVIVTMTNTSGVQQTRTYPASCPVRIRLYRASDNIRVYDETQRSCDATTTTITVDAFGAKTLQSGVRFPDTVAGDSLARATTYTVYGVVLTEGSTLVEIRAGQYAL